VILDRWQIPRRASRSGWIVTTGGSVVAAWRLSEWSTRRNVRAETARLALNEFCRETHALMAANAATNRDTRALRVAMQPWLGSCAATAAALRSISTDGNKRMLAISKTVEGLVPDPAVADQYGDIKEFPDHEPLGKALADIYDWAWGTAIQISGKPRRGYQLPELPPARTDLPALPPTGEVGE